MNSRRVAFREISKLCVYYGLLLVFLAELRPISTGPGSKHFLNHAFGPLRHVINLITKEK